MPDVPAKDWRNSGSGGADGTASKPWQMTEDKSPPSEGGSWLSVKRVIAVFTLVFLGVAIAVVYQWYRPLKPSCLVLIGSGYETNLLFPHNVHGLNGLRILEKEVTDDRDFFADLMRFWWDQPTKLRRVDKVNELADAGWQALWNKLDVPSYRENTVVVFISVHGYADAREAYLLPNVSAEQFLKAPDKARIPFQEVLASLETLANKKVVLLLDVAAAESNWATGMLHNDFVERLQEKYSDKIGANRNLVVICSAGVGQRSWGSDELRRSAFAYFVAEGLKGDGHEANSNVTALSLFKYLEKKVDNWAQTNRARKQTPILLGGEDRADAIRIVHVAEEYESKPIAVPKRDLTNMDDAWSAWHRLRKEAAPHVHAPHLWRTYQDTLLRYEQLVRAGDPTEKAPLLRGELDKIKTDIARRSLESASMSLGNSFPMHRVLGYTPTGDMFGDDALKALLDTLRGADEDQKQAALASYRDQLPGDRAYPLFLRAKLSKLMLQELQGQAKLDRPREQQRLAELEGAVTAPLRSAEAHLLKMLLYGAHPRLDDSLIRQAVGVRMLAEEAALSEVDGKAPGEPYAEAIFPVIRKELFAADAVRREAEDLLFGEPNVESARARVKLVAAHEAYETIRAKARTLQAALALRDDLSNELPYYARWLAAASPIQDQSKADLSALRKQVVDNLGPGLTKLNDLLDQQDMAVSAEFVARLSGDFDALRKAFQNTASRLETLAGLQQNWHALDAVLSIPLVEPDTVARSKLLRKLRDISETMQKNPIGVGTTEKLDPVPERVGRQRALLQASLTSFRKFSGDAKEHLDREVFDLLIEMPGDVVKKSEEASLEKVASVVDAANRCRAIPGALADRIRDDAQKILNPADRLRRLRLTEMCLALAERTLKDHWFDPVENREERYYEHAALGYVESARKLHEDDAMARAVGARADEVKASILARARIAVDPLADVPWTTRDSIDFAGTLRGDKRLPPGKGVFWLERQSSSGPKKIWDRRTFLATEEVLPAKGTEFVLKKFDFLPYADATVNLHAYYRGQHVRVASKSVLRNPDLIVRHFPTPDTAQIAVRMDPTFTIGAISIVLDNSGSMNEPHPVVPVPGVKQRRRFDFALDALEQVLAKIPEKTHLSIYTLGRPLGRNDDTEITEYRPTSEWNRENEFPRMRADIDSRFSPGNIGSPIAEAIVRSMDKGFPSSAKFQGPKMVVVLTDGDDNASFGGKLSADELVRKLKDANDRHSDIVVVVVCFIDKTTDKGKKELESARAQFGYVTEFKPAGQFLDERDGRKLGDRIELEIRPHLKLHPLRNVSPDRLVPPHPVSFFQKDGTLNWQTKVEPGDYHAQIIRSWENEKVDLSLLPAQKLFMIAQRDGTKLKVRRGLIAEQPEVKVGLPPQVRNDWIVSLLQNDATGFKGTSLKQLLVVEKRVAKDARIRQMHPGFVWLELESLRNAELVPLPKATMIWGMDWDVPAPAFRLEMPSWPVAADPKLTAWFWPGDRKTMLAAQGFVTHKDVRVGHRQSVDRKLATAPVIESVDVDEEGLDIVIPSGKGTLKKKCLIVRVWHPKDRPVWVDLESRFPEFPRVGSEHHYYRDESSCTAYFYDLDLKESEVRLVLLDLQAFKKATAEQNASFTPPRNLEPPALFARP